MPLFGPLPIMPKESKTPVSATQATAPYPTAAASAPRNAAIWSSAQDEILLQAKASGMNWQPIANRYFPNKSANACRKRHERLKSAREAEEWDAEKLETLAQQYLAVREEMWSRLAQRVGEPWKVVEAKCMEKGLKTLQATARTAQRRATAGSGDSYDEQGITDHYSDSGVGLGSDAEMEVDDEAGPSNTSSSWHAAPAKPQQMHPDHHLRSRSAPQPLPLQLPLYRPPPPPLNTSHRRTFDAPMTTSPATISYGQPTPFQRYSPEVQPSRAGMSIQSVLSPA